MRKALPICLSTLFFLITGTTLKAQNDAFAYAITDATKEGASWKVLRKIDLKTGEYSPVLFDGMDVKNLPYDFATKKQITDFDPVNPKLPQLAFNTGVAALALDKKHNRLYFTPMHINQLRYLDLASMKVYYLTNQFFSSIKKEQLEAGKTISRMVITPNGTGYAISNDATEFIQFSTGKKPVITQLGSLVDAQENKSISIHNSCSSYGGDMISDDKGSLYLVSGANNVFKIDPQTKIAKHLGSIQGLPTGFATSAVAVTDEGQLLISSSLGKNANYLVNTQNWKAILWQTTGMVYNTSDLANSNYLSTTKKSLTKVDLIKPIVSNLSQNIQIFPNPVVDDSKFSVQFSGVIPGNYVVELVDVSGRRILRKQVTIASANNTQVFSFSPTNGKGLYMVRVANTAKKSVFEQKLLVQ